MLVRGDVRSRETEYIYTSNQQLPFIFIKLNDQISIRFEQFIDYSDNKYRLCGIIYFGSFHFTCRLIDHEGKIWYHDGIQTGSSCRYDSHIQKIHSELLQTAPGHRKKSIAIYTLINNA